MDKKVIEKIINNILSKQLETTKCSKTDLDGADKKAIAQFEEERDDYPETMDDRLELYELHCEEQMKHSFTISQKIAVDYWGHAGFRRINGRIYDTKEYKEMMDKGVVDEKAVIKYTKDLQSAIDDAPRVPNNTVTKREGHWDKGHKEGDVIVQKGFASSSYSSGLDASDTDEDKLYTITYYVPSGRKGLVLTDEQFDTLPEDELLLGRGTRQYVLDQDDEEQTVEVLVLPDR